MVNIHFREENSSVLPKLYLAEVYIEHAHQLTTQGSIQYLLVFGYKYGFVVNFLIFNGGAQNVRVVELKF